jgi:hypothetical protein
MSISINWPSRRFRWHYSCTAHPLITTIQFLVGYFVHTLTTPLDVFRGDEAKENGNLPSQAILSLGFIGQSLVTPVR